MAQHIRVDQLKLGSRLAADVYETTTDGRSLLLYARDQVISSYWQLNRLKDAGMAVVPVSPESVREPVAEGISPDLRLAVEQMRHAVDAARPREAAAEQNLLEAFRSVQASGKPDLAVLESQGDELARVGREEPELLDVLALLREALPAVFRHSRNVAGLALRVQLFRQPRAGDEELRRVALAGLLHDVGLMHCLGTEQLTQQELDETSELFRDHTDFGVEILAGLPGVPVEVRRAAGEHHERINGNGHPQGLSGGDLHPLAELVAICDTYDRLTHGISYRRALSPVAALNLMQGWAGREFHADLVMDFTRAMGPWPLGTPVELENGLRGRISSRRNPHAPVVACKSSGGLQLVDCEASGLAIRRGLAPSLADLHPTEIF
jgi:putative nucleotidyltransferase with HDIG domain